MSDPQVNVPPPAEPTSNPADRLHPPVPLRWKVTGNGPYFVRDAGEPVSLRAPFDSHREARLVVDALNIASALATTDAEPVRLPQNLHEAIRAGVGRASDLAERAWEAMGDGSAGLTDLAQVQALVTRARGELVQALDRLDRAAGNP